MEYRIERHTVAERVLSVYVPSGEGPFPLVWLCAGAAEELVAQLSEDCAVPVLFCTADADWNHDYTPWPAPGLRDRAAFSGGGQAYLETLCTQLLPFVKARYPVCPDAAHTAIMGYSLGGLFALWAACETDAFGAAASLSGSL